MGFIWNPDPVFFTLPVLDHPVRWYGLFFALGFCLGYLLLLPRLKEFEPKNPQKLGDSLLLYMVIATVIGARGGYFLFYDPWTLLESPLEFFKVWNGGLASHGGGIGIVIAIFLFRWRYKETYPTLTVLRLLDLLVVPAALICAFIRLGNFMNQEIVGIPTDLPWAITFMHPMEGVSIVPRHPTQLYESIAYFAIFLTLYFLQLKKPTPGRIAGLFFILAFSARFFLDFTKEDSGAFAHQTDFLQMGQWLCLPFIALGISLLLYSFKKKYN